LPALATGELTFGSFSRLGKINAATIRLWSELLRALPGATLLVAAVPPGRHIARLLEQFAAQGIASERLRLRPRCSMDAYLAVHHEVDICLDPVPFTGLTTSNHALWMGVPTLTLAGATPPGRQGAGLMALLGLDEFIGANPAEFVRQGVYWSKHLSALAVLRAELRGRCQRLPARDPAQIVDAVYDALRHMWRRWCAGLPAESFEIHRPIQKALSSGRRDVIE
jgi:predicted O-linked N-acetylglucosamine transferase (SPINDLY family)